VTRCSKEHTVLFFSNLSRCTRLNDIDVNIYERVGSDAHYVLNRVRTRGSAHCVFNTVQTALGQAEPFRHTD
jgi:hypothetical protein